MQNPCNAFISCRHVWKVFGPRPEKILDLLTSGVSKESISKMTGHVIGVKDVSLDINKNEIFAIMGLSGSGKSTLIRCLNRLIEPTRGEIFIDGININSLSQKELQEFRRRKMSMVFQNFGLLPNRSVLENVAFGLELRGEEKEARVRKSLLALEQVGLQGWGNRRIFELSGGMQQRVGLARALAVDSEIVLMDEPFSSLDPITRRQMQDEFLKLRASFEKTIVFITHDVNEGLKLGDRIAIMKEGEIIQVGTTRQIIENPLDEYITEFIKEIPETQMKVTQAIQEKSAESVRCNFNAQLAFKEL